jgi:hypothetical protein
MKINLTIILATSFAANAAATKAAAIVKSVHLGPRPFFLLEEMRDITLKDELSKYLHFHILHPLLPVGTAYLT